MVSLSILLCSVGGGGGVPANAGSMQKCKIMNLYWLRDGYNTFMVTFVNDLKKQILGSKGASRWAWYFK